MNQDSDIVIVGGGISGLAAAHCLHRLRPDLSVHVIERSRRLGGTIRTDRVDGFVIEGGPDSFLSSKERGVELASEVGMGARLQGTNDRNRRTWILLAGRLHRLPEGLTGLVPSRLEPLLESDLFTAEGKARLLEEPQIPAKLGSLDESLAQFVSRRFGREVYERMIEPLMAGIYAGDGEQLSLAATFPQLRRLEAEHGSIMGGIGASSPARSAPNRPAFLTPIGGMEELVRALASAVAGQEVTTGVGVASVRGTSSGFELKLDDSSRLRARAVILAVPAHAAGQLLRSWDGVLGDALAALPYGSSATVSLAYPAAEVPDVAEGFGYVIPRREGRPVLASTWSSTKFLHRAPPGYALIRMYIGRAGAEDALSGTDGDLIELARDEARSVLGTHAAPLLSRVYRWERGMPQYTLGHLDRIAAIEERTAQRPGLFLAGNYFRGVGIPDCIVSGERAARTAADIFAA